MGIGHADQNIRPQAVALGLAKVEVGAFRDEELGEVLGLEGQIKPLYVMPVGSPPQLRATHANISASIYRCPLFTIEANSGPSYHDTEVIDHQSVKL